MEAEEPVRTPSRSRGQRVHVFSGRLQEVLDDLLGADGSVPVSVSALTAAETAESIGELTRAQARLEALKGLLLTHAGSVDVAAESGATSTGAWLSHATRTPPGRSHGLVNLAGRLQTRFEATGQALAAGAIDIEQARVVADAVDALPCLVGADLRRRAEAHLLGEARAYDAPKLKLLGRHLLAVIDPAGADAELARRLEAEETRAARKTMLTMRDDGHGLCSGSFKISTLHGAMLATALNAIASPKRPDALLRSEPDEHGVMTPISTPELQGRAFCEYLERFPAQRLPKAGGVNATVVVTMTLSTLLDGIGTATLDTGIAISPSQARRLACQAGVIPAVLGSDSAVLDLGRKVRLHTEPMRIALRVQHQTCTAEGCTVPAAWCHAHHKNPWAAGGSTSLREGTLLCGGHHRLAHHAGYDVTYLDNGRTRITKTTRRRQ